MKTIKQVVVFKAEPHEVYEAFMDSKKHAAFTEDKAKISREIHGKIMAYDGYIVGKNIELVQDKKIVQEWTASDWEGHTSKVTFTFEKVKEGTKLIFVQERVPDDQFEAISDGWKEYYWDKLKVFLQQ